MRNFVAKNDFNKGSVHKDLKNDYDRNQEYEDIEEGLNFWRELYLDRDFTAIPDDISSKEDLDKWLNGEWEMKYVVLSTKSDQE